jgi:hypothetical protein
MQLTQIPAGQHVWQVVLTDKLRKEKDRIAVQSIDFEIRP